MKNTEELCEILNKAWNLLPVKPNYQEFNRIFPVGENVNELRFLESEFPILGIARFNTQEEGISILSIIATVTDYFDNGARLGMQVSADGIIEKFVVVRKEN